MLGCSPPWGETMYSGLGTLTVSNATVTGRLQKCYREKEVRRCVCRRRYPRTCCENHCCRFPSPCHPSSGLQSRGHLLDGRCNNGYDEPLSCIRHRHQSDLSLQSKSFLHNYPL